MDEMIPTPEFEKMIRQSFGVPQIRTVFVEDLHRELMQRAEDKSRHSRPLIGLRRGWIIACALLVFLTFAVLVIGPQRVYAAVTHFFGYLPGVGIIDQSSPVRMLVAPVTITRDGVTLTVQSAYLTENKTTLTYMVKNVPASAHPTDENVAGCVKIASLVLPDGQALAATGGQGTGSRFEINYPPIAPAVEEAHFILPCLLETLPGKAPEDWDLTLQFMPAPPDLTLAPVIDLATLTPLPTTHLQTNTPQPAVTSPYGIQFTLDQAISIDDGYYLIGHSTWSDPRISEVNPFFRAFDANGQEVPLEVTFFSDAGLDPQPGHWLFKLYGKIFNGPLTLRAEQIGIQLAQSVTVTFDPRTYGFDGTDAQLNRVAETVPAIPMKVLDMKASIVHLKYLKQGDEKGFEVAIEADSSLLNLPLNLDSPVTGGRGASGGGGSQDDVTGRLLSYVLSDGQMDVPVTFGATGFLMSGSWETNWDPPVVVTDVTPTPVLQACLALDGWKEALKTPAVLPAGLSGKVLLSRLVGNHYALVVANLDGSDQQVVVDSVINPNSSLSQDGTRVVYTDPSSGIVVVNVQSGQRTPLTGSGMADSDPKWSPDGKQIAFTHRGDVAQIYVIDANGMNLRAITPPGFSQLSGWSPDSAQVLYVTKVSDVTSRIHLSAVNTSSITDLFTVDYLDPRPSISPDGQWIVYQDRVPGRFADGIYLSRSDGSDRRLLVQLDDRYAGNVHWSPDGQWMVFSAQDNLFYGTTFTGLLNVSTCQVTILPGLDGEIVSWIILKS